ncbi:MAG: translational GTPase TypA [Proteobacteria bacterium]|nr:translational GTPase TypA [Pseudomonadota bacterium]
MATDIKKIRNIAIIAHVDHGKTTLLDKLLRDSGTLKASEMSQERVMDSNEIEKERGITILAKNTSLTWNGYQINIIDTPGHADFGGEVERGLSMVDSVLLLVDAVDGPMPQTRFVTSKALKLGLRPIVVINKVDRDGARPDWALDQTFDLFDKLGASSEQLDFPIVYTSAIQGWAAKEPKKADHNMSVLFQCIVDNVPHPKVDLDGPFRMQVSALDYSSYVGVIGVGRIQRGTVKLNDNVSIINKEGKIKNGKILQILGFLGLARVEKQEASAGEIIMFSGIDGVKISDTVCDPKQVEALPPLVVDEPTISMTFQVNTSPFAGKEGKYVTTRNIKDRLDKELIHNVALRVSETESPDKYRVSGRGELHLSILIENMRREGYELAISRPEVIIKKVDGQDQEPFEALTIDIEEQHQGKIMEKLGERKGDLKNMVSDSRGRVRLDYIIPTRGLIGFRSDFLSTTSGTGLMYHSFDHYGPKINQALGERNNGVLISKDQGKAVTYAIFHLQDRGRFFISHGDEVYGGQVIGIHNRDNDLVVNPLIGKKVSNVRSVTADEALVIVPPIKTTLEYSLQFINDDELVEVTIAGDIQVMSAGTGVIHSEYNLEDQETNIYQIWIIPNKTSVKPRWEAKEFPKDPVKNNLNLLISGFGKNYKDGTLGIYQDAYISGGKINKGTEVNYNIKHQVYLLCSYGKILINDKILEKGDAAEISNIKEFKIKANDNSEVLVIDAPK